MMSARIYPDVSILLTLDYEQEPLLRKCTIFQKLSLLIPNSKATANLITTHKHIYTQVKIMKCPNCQSSHTIKHGTTTTIKDGKQPRYKCQECGKTFYQPKEEKRK
jgi:transposase-like protein